MRLPLLSSRKDLVKLLSTEVPAKSEGGAAKKHSYADWDRFINEWETSGLTKKIFCTQRGLNVKTFANQCARKYNQTSDTKQFMEVNVATSSNSVCSGETGFVLRCVSGTKLSIPNNCDKATLRELLVLLGVC